MLCEIVFQINNATARVVSKKMVPVLAANGYYLQFRVYLWLTFAILYTSNISPT